MIDRLAVAALLLQAPAPVLSAGPKAGIEGPAQERAQVAAWDTVQPSAASPTPESLAARSGWSPVPRDQTLAAFRGDAVATNGRLTAVLRRQDAALEIFSGTASRARLVLRAGGKPAARLASAALVENSRGAACLEASFATASGATAAAKFRLKRGDLFVEVEPGPGADEVRVEAPGRYAVLPDFFADDFVVDAARIPAPSAEIPSENFLIHLAGRGDALVMAVFENREQDARVTLSGEGAARVLSGSEIRFGKGRKKVWVAVLEAPRIWHAAEVRAEDAGRVVPLDWKMPFPAQWRVDFTRSDDLAHSWEMLLQEKEGGEYLKPSVAGNKVDRIPPDRKRWMGSLMYTVSYPCWSDPQGRGFVQPLKYAWMTHRGPVLVYPANRVPSTPVEAFTVVDVVRATLGQGPCEYILDLESQKAERKGRATCSVRDELKAIYEKGQQKARRRDVERFLQDGIDFVKHIRGRIEQYLAFAREMRALLAERKKAGPELASALAPLEKPLAEVDELLEKRREKIKTPEHVVAMTEEFRKTLLDYEGSDAADRVKKYTDELTDIGDNQDGMVARLRWAIKTLRERAGMLMTQDPRLAPLAQEIRERSRAVLKNPAIHEEARQ
jgi:hypothetical protein